MSVVFPPFVISITLALLLSACTQAPVAPTPPTPATADYRPSLVGRTEGGVPAGGAVLTTVEIAKLIRPSVVHVQTEAVEPGFFFQPVPVTGVGTGIIVDTQGHILTNNHVIENANKITVSLSDGRGFEAQVTGRDPVTDLAVISINADGLAPARLGDASKLQVGEDVIAIGHALDLPGGPTVSKGVVSALNRSIGVDPQTVVDGLVQIDAPIHPGNSGGPLVNGRGEVVGVNTAIIPGSQGIGFAINIDDAKAVMAQLLEKGLVERAFLGIVHVNITPVLAKASKLPVDHGVGVQSVARGSPADKGGLREGDILVQIGDQPLQSTADLIRFLTAHKTGETAEVTHYRGGAKQTTLVTLGPRPR